MIQIKSHFGNWKTVGCEQAQAFILAMLNRGAKRAAVESHIRGIAIEELLNKLPVPAVQNAVQDVARYVKADKPATGKRSSDMNLQEVKNCTVELEKLSRLRAFYRFQQEILFSLMVWQNDEQVRKQLPPVREWVKECVGMLQNDDDPFEITKARVQHAVTSNSQPLKRTSETRPAPNENNITSPEYEINIRFTDDEEKTDG